MIFTDAYILDSTYNNSVLRIAHERNHSHPIVDLPNPRGCRVSLMVDMPKASIDLQPSPQDGKCLTVFS